jgi:hypothetical protein
MRTRFVILILVLSVLSFTLAAIGQAGRPGTAASAVDVNGKSFNPRDFSGIWKRSAGDPGFSPPANIPPLTPAGEAVIKTSTIVGRTRHPLLKSVNDPKASNDPVLACNPKGFPRLIVDRAHDFHEVVMLPDRMLQLWQEERRPREIWIDGRVVPSPENLENLGPAWYGHSVGVWEGDTLVVTAVGMDERAWVDSFGFPKSFGALVQERYRLADPNTLELQLTLHDPEYYTRDWVSDVKVWKKEPRRNMTNLGWYGLFSGATELICAPINLEAQGRSRD